MSKNSLFRASSVATVGFSFLAATLLLPGFGASAAERSQISAAATKDDTALMARQDNLLAAAKEICAGVAREVRSGFSGIELTVEKSVLDLYWKGTAPPPVRSLVTRLNERGDRTIRLQSARYSLAELNQEISKVVKERDTAYGEIVRVAPLHDGSGLQLAVDGKGESAGLRYHEQAPPPAGSGIATSVPVSIEIAPPALPADRIDDSSPYWGGNLMINQARGNACTSAFGVRRNSDRAPRLLTAAHCGKAGDRWIDGGGDAMGAVEGNWPPYETQLINTPGDAAVWHGTVNSNHTSGSDETRKIVKGWAFPEAGQLVCSSGAYSGSRCVIKVTHNNVTLNLDGIMVPGMVQAEQQGRTNAAGNGDSGGPVYGVRSDGNATASGIISAIDLNTKVSCTGVPADTYRTCAWRMFYVNIQNAMNISKTTIMTG